MTVCTDLVIDQYGNKYCSYTLESIGDCKPERCPKRNDEIVALILREARKDCFQGVGRIFVKSFMKEYNITQEQLLEALRRLDRKFTFKYYLDEPKILLVQL